MDAHAKPERAIKTVEDAIRLVEASGLTHIKVGLSDTDGILRGKYLRKDKFLGALRAGFAFCNVVLGWDVDDQIPQRFPARIAVQSMNEPGSLAQIAQVIAEHDGNIDNIRMSRQSPDFTSVTIDLEVYDLKHLTAIIAQLRAKRVVARAERVSG